MGAFRLSGVPIYQIDPVANAYEQKGRDMLTSGRVGYARLRAGSLAWRSAIAVLFLAAAFPAEAQDGNWNGFYAGLNAGGTWGSNDVDIGCRDSGLLAGFCAAASAGSAFPFSMSNDLDGFIGGAQAGYNFQHGKMVFGIEADISWTSADSSTSIATGPTGVCPGPSCFPEANVARVSQDLEYLATVRGRLGYAVHGNMLVYATGGLAFGEVNNSYGLEFSGGDFNSVSNSKTKAGWTVGGGAEYSFGHWSLKGEYLYYDLGKERESAQFYTAGVPDTAYQDPEFETKGQLVRVGVNFKFGHRSRGPVPLK